MTPIKTAFITGANKSIGFETARQLALAGYHIFLGSRDPARGAAAATALRAEGLNAITVIEIDTSNAVSVTRAILQPILTSTGARAQ